MAAAFGLRIAQNNLANENMGPHTEQRDRFIFHIKLTDHPARDSLSIVLGVQATTDGTIVLPLSRKSASLVLIVFTFAKWGAIGQTSHHMKAVDVLCDVGLSMFRSGSYSFPKCPNNNLLLEKEKNLKIEMLRIFRTSFYDECCPSVQA